MKAKFLDDNFYHVYNRGAHKSRIFFTDGNYEYCLDLMRKYTVKYRVSTIAYCLMPNHYHLLLRQNAGGSIGRFLQTTFNAYTQAVNKQQKLHGTLFESRAQSLHVDSETYLLRLVCYIHCNPVAAGLVTSPEQWRFSDYSVWAGLRKGEGNDTNLREMYFERGTDYVTFVEEYLSQIAEAKKCNVEKPCEGL